MRQRREAGQYTVCEHVGECYGPAELRPAEGPSRKHAEQASEPTPSGARELGHLSSNPGPHWLRVSWGTNSRHF